MIIEVKNEQELTLFNAIWRECWKEMGFEFEESSGAKYLFEKEGRHVGVVQFSRMAALKEIFLTHPEIAKNVHKVMEIDKLSILKEERGKKILSEFIELAVRYGEENDIPYFTSLCEPKLYIALKRFYKIPLTPMGGKVWYKGDYVQPVIWETKKVREHIEKQKLLSKV